MSDPCYGCGTDCGFKEDNINGSCPCTYCIVKTMCGNSCLEWDKWNSKTSKVIQIRRYQSEYRR